MPTMRMANGADRGFADNIDLFTVDDEVLASTKKQKEDVVSRWDAIIDQKLIKWGEWCSGEYIRSEFGEEGFTIPSGESIRKAFALLKHMRDQGWPLPTGVIPDGEGGIVLENRHDLTYQRIEIDDHGAMNLLTFRDCILQGHPMPIDLD